MHKQLFSAAILLLLSAALFGCQDRKEPVPVPVPTAEAITAFAGAAFNGDATAVSAALADGMPVNQVEENGNSALWFASFDGHIETMKVLLDAGEDVNQRDRMNRKL